MWHQTEEHPKEHFSCHWSCRAPTFLVCCTADVTCVSMQTCHGVSGGHLLICLWHLIIVVIRACGQNDHNGLNKLNIEDVSIVRTA